MNHSITIRQKTMEVSVKYTSQTESSGSLNEPINHHQIEDNGSLSEPLTTRQKAVGV